MMTGAKPRTLLNGSPVDQVSVYDRGLCYGDGLFETIRVCQGVLCRFQDHLGRLQSGARALAIPLRGVELIEQELADLVRGDTGVLRLTLTRGPSQRGYSIPDPVLPNRIASFFPGPIPSWPTNGVRLHQCKLRLARQPALAGIKHLNRLEQVLARSEVQQGDCDEGMMLSTDGHPIECTASNLFLGLNGQLVTPSLDDCGVAGVMRGWILEQPDVASRVAQVSLKDLRDADEVLICNSVMGIASVTQMGSMEWRPGPISQRLRSLDEAQYG